MTEQAQRPWPVVRRYLELWWVQVGLILLAVVVAYGHTLDVPFYYDDYSSISENPAITERDGIGALWDYAGFRTVSYLTLALDYRWHGESVAGYHLTNIVIHMLAGCAVLGFVRALVSTPVLGTRISSTSYWLPLLVALLFVLHPLQTQAVTYIVQRLAALAALFYVAAMASYVKARLADSAGRRYVWLLVTLVSGCLAILSKQNAVTLPLALLLIEWVFFRPGRRRVLTVLGVGILALAVMWIAYALSRGANPFALASLGAITRDTADISRLDYFSTQLSVLWTYIGRFVWPVGLRLDYDVRLADGFGGQTLAALAAHIAVLGVAVYLVRRLPLVAFGILFYYLAHTVESGIIPIRHWIFEHRTYLPNLGLCLAAGDLLLRARRFLTGPLLAAGVVGLLLVLTVATWQRNQEWRDPVSFWQRNAKLTPESPRPLEELASLYLKAGRNEEALQLLELSLAKTGRADRRGTMRDAPAVNYVLALYRTGRHEEALKAIDQLADERLKRYHYAVLMNAKGDILLQQRRPAEAAAAYREALRVSADNLHALGNLAKAMAAQGDMAAFERIYAQIRAQYPDAQEAIAHLDQVRAVLQQR